MTDRQEQLNSAGNLADTRKPDRIFVAIDGSPVSGDIVRFGAWLAGVMNVPWEAVFTETPARRTPDILTRAGEALTLAAQLGATVYRVPATSTPDALHSHMNACSAPHVVIAGHHRGLLRRIASPSLAAALVARNPQVVVHVFAAGDAPAPSVWDGPEREAPPSAYLKSTGLVAATLAVALVIALVTGSNYLSVLLLFPVIAAASLLGLRPALLAAALSTAGFNLLFLKPLRHFDPLAGQSWLMLIVLAGVAIYTAWLTGALRGRLELSDRTAQEAAQLAAFAQKLTRVSDWTSTAVIVCEEVHQLLGVHTMVFREVNGRLEAVAADPPEGELAPLDPLDRAALDLAWDTGEPSGSGTTALRTASWQFHPLKTSLGTLAVLALSREDGRDPVPVERGVLLGTVIAQAALAHERLRLEDEAIAQACG